MIGKTFKGLSDEMLAWQTERLLGLARSREEWTVRAEPALVVEVAFDGVQRSPHYPGGVALRFARVKRFRPDKRAAQADTLAAVLAIHAAATGGASATGAGGAAAAGCSAGGCSGLIVLTRRGGPSTGAVCFGGSGFFGAAAFFAPGFGGAAVSANMSPLGSEMPRCRAMRSTNDRATTSSIVLDALFSSMP